ncbi:hypothetical protein GC176_19810 [bacterium]|nr:hypothetical protein [bacterium]
MNENLATTDSSDGLRSIVLTLDELVPRDSSWVQLTQYGGGPDEGQIIGNRSGYQRLGIEFLKATIATDADKEFGVDLEYLVLPNSTIGFDWFELSETPPPASANRTWLNRLIALGRLTFFVTVLGLYAIGLVTVAQWVAM